MAIIRAVLPTAFLMGALLAGCASGETATIQPASLTTAPAGAPAAESPIKQVSTTVTRSPGMQADGTYVLSPEELKLDCKKLTGRAMVRILQMRNHEIRNNSSIVSRTTQQAVVPIFGGTKYGADPEADYKRDRALLVAYNARLAEKKCKVFDLVKELQPKPAGEAPIPVKKNW